MTSATTIRTVARERFGLDELRPGQLEAITAAAGGRDVLAVMPTGYGKSAIYQVAAALVDGPTLVVAPLIALQVDQVAAITEAEDAPDAVAVNSAQSARTTSEAWEALSTDQAEYLFLAPEQLAKDEVVERLCRLGVSLFAVDEAHCVSSWGHDFRPDYLRLGEVVERLGHPTVVALTATGSPPVREEVVERLGLRDPLVLTRGFDRPNLRLEVVRHTDDKEKRRSVIEQLVDLPKPGLLYVATRKDTQRYADDLADRGLRVAPYHAGLRATDRRRTHQGFRDDEYDVVVATSAFGMGIDKPDVRFVVHAAIPESIDDLYQEVGRAGRDGDTATTTLHYRPEDLGLRTFFASGTPARADLSAAYRAVRAAGEPIRVSAVAAKLEVGTRRASTLLNLLQEAGLVESGRRGLRATGDVEPKRASALAVEAAETRQRIEHSRIAMVRSYAETPRCRRQFLLGYFGEDLDEPCGNCDTCSSGSAYEVDTADEAGSDDFPAQSSVRHRDWGLGTVMSTEDDRITVFFEDEGYKVLSLAVVREHDLLEAV